MTKKTLFMILAAVVVIAVAIVLVVSSQDNSGQLQQRLSARQATTLKIIADGQKNIGDDDLGKLNSELNIILSSDNNELQAALKTAGMKKVDKKITAAEADLDTFKKLATAKLNAQYDTAYRSVLTQKLESLRALMRELHDATNSRSLKAALSLEYKHVNEYLDTLSKL